MTEILTGILCLWLVACVWMVGGVRRPPYRRPGRRDRRVGGESARGDA